MCCVVYGMLCCVVWLVLCVAVDEARTQCSVQWEEHANSRVCAQFYLVGVIKTLHTQVLLHSHYTPTPLHALHSTSLHTHIEIYEYARVSVLTWKSICFCRCMCADSAR